MMNHLHMCLPKRDRPWSRSAGGPNPEGNSGPNPTMEFSRTPIGHPGAWSGREFACDAFPPASD